LPARCASRRDARDQLASLKSLAAARVGLGVRGRSATAPRLPMLEAAGLGAPSGPSPLSPAATRPADHGDLWRCSTPRATAPPRSSLFVTRVFQTPFSWCRAIRPPLYLRPARGRLYTFNFQRPARRRQTLRHLPAPSDGAVNRRCLLLVLGWDLPSPPLFRPVAAAQSGYGTSLITAVENEARARCCGHIILGRLRLPAPEFLRRLGFSRWRRPYPAHRGHRSTCSLKRLNGRRRTTIRQVPHSLTTIVPFTSAWPVPQKMSQRKVSCLPCRASGRRHRLVRRDVRHE